MDAGRLRERLTIEREAAMPNGQGGYETAWSTLAAGVPAEVIALSGDEALRLGVERATAQFRVRIRARPDPPTEKDRLRWRNRLLAIRSVLPDPRDLGVLLIIAESGAV